MTDWALAACAGRTLEFFPAAKGEHYAEVAKEVGVKYCKPCPIRTDCLEEALNIWPLPADGVWAGKTPAQLKKAWSERKAYRA